MMTRVPNKQEVTKSHKVKEKGQKITKGQIIPKDLKTTTRRKRTGEAQKVQTVRLTKEKEKQPTMMMMMMTMMMSSLLIKLQVESDPWVRNCRMALRSSRGMDHPGT